MRTNGYTIDYAKKEIIITKTFAKQASMVYDSEEYNTLKGLRADFPEYEVKQKKIKKNSKKKTYAKLTYKKMEAYIILMEGKRSATLEEFDFQKELAKFKPSPYAYTKNWFLTKYPEFEPEEQEEETIEESIEETHEAA